MRGAIALLALPAVLFSNDTLMTLGAGGLVPAKSSAISIESEDLEISARLIKVKYVFRNHTASAIEGIVAFPLPAINGGDVEHVPMSIPSKDPVNFVDFRITAGGKAIQPNVAAKAFAKDRDITERLRGLRIPVSVIDKGLGAAIQRVPASERKRLQDEELIVCEDHGCWATWESRVRFWWRQHFPAGATVAIEHTYRPVVGGAYIVYGNDGAETIKPYCGGADALAQIAAQKKAHPPKDLDDIALYENRIQYILTTANNWSGPIRKFRLSVVTESPDDIVASCAPGLQRVAPGRYEAFRTGFRPEKELDVLILTRRR